MTETLPFKAYDKSTQNESEKRKVPYNGQATDPGKIQVENKEKRGTHGMQ